MLLPTAVTYGPKQQPTRYACAVFSVTATLIVCDTAAGVGKALHFQVTVRGAASTVGTDNFAYAQPVLSPGTIRFAAAGSPPTTNLYGSIACSSRLVMLNFSWCR